MSAARPTLKWAQWAGLPVSAMTAAAKSSTLRLEDVGGLEQELPPLGRRLVRPVGEGGGGRVGGLLGVGDRGGGGAGGDLAGDRIDPVEGARVAGGELAVGNDQLGVEHDWTLQFLAAGDRRGGICIWHGTRPPTSPLRGGRKRRASDADFGRGAVSGRLSPPSRNRFAISTSPQGGGWRRRVDFVSLQRSGHRSECDRRAAASHGRRRRDKPRARRGRRQAGWPRHGRRCGRSRSGSRDRRSPGSALAFCSTSRTPTPVSRIWASAWNSSWVSIGDRPSDGSSRSSTSGADIMARPMATICCSPPLMVRTVCVIRSLRRGKRSRTMSRLRASSARARWGWAPSSRFSRTVSSAKMPRPSGTSATPASTIWCGCEVGQRAAAEGDRAARQVRHDAGDDLEQGRLAGAVGAEDDDDLARRRRRGRCRRGRRACHRRRRCGRAQASASPR